MRKLVIFGFIVFLLLLGFNTINKSATFLADDQKQADPIFQQNIKKISESLKKHENIQISWASKLKVNQQNEARAYQMAANIAAYILEIQPIKGTILPEKIVFTVSSVNER